MVSGQEYDETKRKAMIQQLDAAQAEQVAAKERRRQQQSLQSDPRESVETFTERWIRHRSTAEECIAHFERRPQATNPLERATAKAAYQNISKLLFDLEYSVASAAYFLPAFEVRTLGEATKQMRKQLQVASAQVLPHQPFHFTCPEAIVMVDDPMQQGLIPDEDGNTAPNVPTRAGNATLDGDSASCINGLRGQTITLHSEQLLHSDYKLSNLQDCKILLHGPLQALYIHNVNRCHIQAGPVAGATIVDGSQSCTLMLATHQLRLHCAKNCGAYICAGSNPIIEHCTDIGFAPLLELPYPGYSLLLKNAGIAVAGGKWQMVQDFQNPDRRLSPNWFVVPEEERVCPVATS